MPLTKQSSALVCTITYNYKIHILADLVICWSYLYVTYTNWYQSQIALITKKSVPPVLQWFQASADRLVGDFQPHTNLRGILRRGGRRRRTLLDRGLQPPPPLSVESQRFRRHDENGGAESDGEEDHYSEDVTVA